MPLLHCSRQGLGECEEPGRCSRGAFFTRGPRPSFASRQPLKTCDHSHCGKLAFVGNSGGDGLRGKGHIPKIVFVVGITFILIALAMVNESEPEVEDVLGFMF